MADLRAAQAERTNAYGDEIQPAQGEQGRPQVPVQHATTAAGDHSSNRNAVSKDLSKRCKPTASP